MTDRIRIIRHEVVPKCGSYEVRFSDGLSRSGTLTPWGRGPLAVGNFISPQFGRTEERAEIWVKLTGRELVQNVRDKYAPQ
jgi:hypothetical protein